MNTQELENRAAHPHQEFPGVPPGKKLQIIPRLIIKKWQLANNDHSIIATTSWEFFRNSGKVEFPLGQG